MHKEKIIKAVDSAMTYLKNAIDSHTKGNEEKVVNLTWKASSDLEYALFLFAFESPKKILKLSWKLSSKQTDIESILVFTLKTLKEAVKNLDRDDLYEAYKKTWTSKGHLLKIHELFEKKREKNRKR